jgi:hypothetical protein
MNRQRLFLLLLALILLGGCATMPTGPTVMVMPGPGKPFEIFQADDYVCRQWAQQQIGGTSPSGQANQNLATGAVLGTLLGAGAGAAIGSISGQAGAGAAIGAGAGLLTGTAAASGPSYNSERALQRQYNIAYQQCMYSKGNQIPGVAARRQSSVSAPPPSAYGPPPGAQPQSAAPPPAQSSGTWLTVPGQYVNGKWVPEHRVQVPATP